MSSELSYWLGFSAFPGVGPLRFRLLLDYFGSGKKAWEASGEDLRSIGMGDALSLRFVAFRRTFSLTGYEQKVKDLGVKILTLNDLKYPRLLKEIPAAPFVLYVVGSKPLRVGWDISRSVAIVGTRQVTAYGRIVTETLATDLARSGITIVSGLALGVDAIAHEAAIDAGGMTIAVLGCGVDCCNPRTNQYLYDRIKRGTGAIVSEFPLSQRVGKGLFPSRNRIISGLSLGTLVTEGAQDSGALITARFAAEQGREVFAVPGPITSIYSQGPMELLKSGAKLVTSASDILEELRLGKSLGAEKDRVWQTDGQEQLILECLQGEAMGVDDMLKKVKIPMSQLLQFLSVLEIKGYVKNDGGVYVLQR